MSSKLRNRFHIHKDYKDLATKLDMTIFPQEVGGKTSMIDMIEHFKLRMLKNHDIILSNDKIDIINPVQIGWFQNTDMNDGVSGSFRKIEFD